VPFVPIIADQIVALGGEVGLVFQREPPDWRH
jgi:hypothetical protein